MKKYYCLNGEIVQVEDFHKSDSLIYIHYKGKRYQRSIDIINKTIFPNNPKQKKVSKKKICIGNIVHLKEIVNNKSLIVKICDTHTGTKYRSMGGSYHQSEVDLYEIVDNLGTNNGIEHISNLSPVGKALLGHSEGEIITVLLPNGNYAKYIILNINE